MHQQISLMLRTSRYPYLLVPQTAMDYSSSTRAKRPKKKGRKGKSQTRSGIEKSLENKKNMQPAQPAMQFAMLDAPTQPGNILFQEVDLSSSFPMGQMNYEKMQPGLSPSFPNVSRELDFITYHASEPSSNGRNNQQV
uniref:Uncharacterized protein n=1 Tax=Arundo donax TaxID=35708 RepID=A0A0A9EFR1_ARUDO